MRWRLPTAVFVAAILTVILAGLLREGPAVVAAGSAEQAGQVQTNGVRQAARRLAGVEPGGPLVALYDEHRRITAPIISYIRHLEITTVFVLIPEGEPEHPWQRILQNNRGALLAHALREDTDAVVCRLRFRVPDDEPEQDVAPTLVSVSKG